MSPGPVLYLIITMGIRLFPCTDDNTFLAKLINIPTNTFERLDDIERECMEEKVDWIPEYMERINAENVLQIADEFKVFGWGSFAHPTDTEYGDTNNPELARKLFDSATNKHLSDHIPFERVLLLSDGFKWR